MTAQATRPGPAGGVPAPHGPGRRRTAAELEALAREASARFADANAD